MLDSELGICINVPADVAFLTTPLTDLPISSFHGKTEKLPLSLAGQAKNPNMHGRREVTRIDNAEDVEERMDCGGSPCHLRTASI